MAATTATNVGTAAAPVGSCTTAVRHSVARTRKAYGGTAVAASTVTSTTQGLRLAYPNEACDI